MGLGHGASRSAPWLPLDLVLEDVMDGYQVNATSAIEILTGKDRSYPCFLENCFNENTASVLPKAASRG